MLEHILVAFDGSGPSRHAARFGLALAAQCRAKVTLLCVLPEPEVFPLGPLGTSVIARMPNEAEMAKVRQQLDAIAAERPSVPVEAAVVIGPVAETIITTAEHRRVDLIVIGARGLNIARRFLLGSVSDRVVHHAHCPVTVWR